RRDPRVLLAIRPDQHRDVGRAADDAEHRAVGTRSHAFLAVKLLQPLVDLFVAGAVRLGLEFQCHGTLPGFTFQLSTPSTARPVPAHRTITPLVPAPRRAGRWRSSGTS